MKLVIRNLFSEQRKCLQQKPVVLFFSKPPYRRDPFAPLSGISLRHVPGYCVRDDHCLICDLLWEKADPVRRLKSNPVRVPVCPVPDPRFFAAKRAAPFRNEQMPFPSKGCQYRKDRSVDTERKNIAIGVLPVIASHIYNAAYHGNRISV